MADIFSVIADPTRRHLLELLLQRYVEESDEGAEHGGEASVSELVTALALSQPTVSKHLKVLREASLVQVREEGQHRYYKLDAAPLEDVEDWLISFLSADFDIASMAAEDAAWDEAARAGAGVEAGSSPVAAFAKTVGRTAAETTHQARELVEDLQANATKLVSRLRK